MRKILAILLLVMMTLVLFSCAKPEEEILGTWKHQNTVLGVVTETTYTFNADGTGTKSNVLDVDFTYSFLGDKLQITTSALGVGFVEQYTFDFKGDKLLLTDEKETLELQKVK